MKKFFLIAAAAIVAFASCSKNETPLVQEENNAIGFNSYAGRAVSKAGDTFIPEKQTWLNQGKAFGVYAYNTKAATFAPDPETGVAGYDKFMVNEKVTFTGSTAAEAEKYNNYKYDNKKYWPNDETNNLLTFWAYYPHNALTKGFEANDFTVEKTPANMVDLLLSDVKPDMTYTDAKKEGTVGYVDFMFHHALTMVKFKVMAAEDYAGATITLNSFVVVAKKQGTVTPVFNDETKKTSFEWEPAVDTAHFNVCTTPIILTANGAWLPSNTAAATTTSDAVSPVACPPADAYLMIPQDLATIVNGTNATEEPIVYAEIKYTVTSTDQNVTPVVNTVKVGLKTDKVATWAMNKNIVYTFTVGLKPIEFTASVTDWEEPVISTGITID